MSSYYHLAIAWDWEYDKDFVALLESQVQTLKLRSYSVTHHNVQETIKKLSEE